MYVSMIMPQWVDTQRHTVVVVVCVHVCVSKKVRLIVTVKAYKNFLKKIK